MTPAEEIAVPEPSLIAAFDAAQQRHTEAVAELTTLLAETAVATVADRVPDGRH